MMRKSENPNNRGMSLILGFTHLHRMGLAAMICDIGQSSHNRCVLYARHHDDSAEPVATDPATSVWGRA